MGATASIAIYAHSVTAMHGSCSEYRHTFTAVRTVNRMPKNINRFINFLFLCVRKDEVQRFVRNAISCYFFALSLSLSLFLWMCRVIAWHRSVPYTATLQSECAHTHTRWPKTRAISRCGFVPIGGRRFGFAAHITDGRRHTSMSSLYGVVGVVDVLDLCMRVYLVHSTANGKHVYISGGDSINT